MKVLVPIVTVPVRELVPVLAATWSVTVPLPSPVAPALTLIHEALLVATQGQTALAVTVTLAEPPAAGSDTFVAEMVGGQDAVNPNVFERALGVTPPGPTALTTAS